MAFLPDHYGPDVVQFDDPLPLGGGRESPPEGLAGGGTSDVATRRVVDAAGVTDATAAMAGLERPA